MSSFNVYPVLSSINSSFNFDMEKVETRNLYKWYMKHCYKNGRFFYDVSTGKTIEKNQEADQVYVFDKTGNFCIVDAYSNVYEVLDACNRKYTPLYIFHLEMNEMKIRHLQDIERLERSHRDNVVLLSTTINELSSSIKQMFETEPNGTTRLTITGPRTN